MSCPTSPVGEGTAPTPKKRIDPPRWIAYALLCVGGVLILHSFALPKPD